MEHPSTDHHVTGSPSASHSPPADVGHAFPFPGGPFTVTLTLIDATGLSGSDTIVVCLADFTPD